MSFYNMLFGKNPNAEELLSVLGLEECQIERFRDCYVEDNKIVILTRTGGLNRETWQNEVLINHPCYLYDKDDDYDNTYAYYYFSLPEPSKGE